MWHVPVLFPSGGLFELISILDRSKPRIPRLVPLFVAKQMQQVFHVSKIVRKVHRQTESARQNRHCVKSSQLNEAAGIHKEPRWKLAKKVVETLWISASVKIRFQTSERLQRESVVDDRL